MMRGGSEAKPRSNPFNAGIDFQVRKDDLQETRFAESETPELESGQVLLGVDSFGLTTNNIT